MQDTDKVIVIKEFIYNSNRYPANKEPYLYGQLPKQIRDNRDFVVPVENVIVTSTVIPNNLIHVTESADKQLKQEIITREIVEAPVVEVTEPIVDQVLVTEDKVEEIPVVETPVKSTKRKSAA